MKVLSVCICKAEARPGNLKTGINKHATSDNLLVGLEGLERDTICNRHYHGGPEQAVYIEGDLTRLWWEQELGVPVHHGLFGENLCLEGLDNRDVAAGDRFSTAHLIMEVTAPRMPCRILSEKMRERGFAKRYIEAARPGFYCRVVQPGFIAVGAKVKYEPFEGQRILTAEMMAHHGTRASPDLIERYRNVPAHAKLLGSLSRGTVKF
ncbi:MOSC domain-containing protein [Ensifer sp. 4252]|uniref:MOSC domain-containing protein n=1 Tax=Ensifer sp. 4252 TaxID=3373915 RepID=UPI003D24BAB9